MNNIVIEKPTCKTCPYYEAKESECRSQAEGFYHLGSDYWCAEHPDFTDYLTAINADKPNCPECIHYTVKSTEEKESLTGRHFKEDGRCAIGNRPVWEDTRCYLFTAK
jgi:hypothetical protein